MNIALKAAIFNPQSHFINLRAALFHSTPVLERKRHSHWHTPGHGRRFTCTVEFNFWDSFSKRSHPNSNSYSKRFRRAQSKKLLLRNISAFADQLFQSWQEEINDDDPLSSRGTSWFKKDYGRSKQSQNHGRQGRGRRGAWVCEELDEDEGFDDVERVFESIFGRRQHFHWSFTYEDNNRWRSSSSYGYNYWDHQNWRSRDHQNWRSRIEEDYEFEEESESSEFDMASHRQALGLGASGPLKLEDVKIAYRACALKWHPDRHQGSSKAVAEEKFKLCSAAYQSLCDKLAVD